ncbi:MAG TPA: GNAT family N-acetyltransferase [Streptosporangiaceae bacterium]
MDVASLGFRTDLMLRRLAGADIVDRGEYLVVRTPSNPAFWWGNFLLFPAPAATGAAARWLTVFAAEFPQAGHRAIGVDGTSGDYGDPGEFAVLGLTAEVNTVLTAQRLREPPARRPGSDGAADAACRPLAGDSDWAQADTLTFACDDRSDDPEHRLFLTARQREARALCEAGHGAWFGAFVDGQMRSGCGIFTDAAGLARFQNVETHPAYRRRGLASQVVYQAGRYAVQELGATTLVIVADPADVAIGIYRSLGFADAERQVQLQREAATPGSRPATPWTARAASADGPGRAPSTKPFQ